MKKYLIVGSMVLCCSAMIASDNQKQEKVKSIPAQAYDLVLVNILEKPELEPSDLEKMSDIISHPYFSFEEGGAADIIPTLIQNKGGVVESLAYLALEQDRGRPVKFLLEKGLITPDWLMVFFFNSSVSLKVTVGAFAYIFGRMKEDDDFKSKLNSYLFQATQANIPSLIGLLLKTGANPNLKGEYGTTPWNFAISRGGADLVKTFLEAKVNPNLQDENGDTPLNLATRIGKNGIVELLLEAQADPNLQDGSGATPLTVNRHIFFGSGSPICDYITHRDPNPNLDSIIQLLLEANADPNLQDGNGDTPLSLAVRKSNPPFSPDVIRVNARMVESLLKGLS